MQIQVLPTFSLWGHSPHMHCPSSGLPAWVWYSRYIMRMAITLDSGPRVGGGHGQGSWEERQWPSTFLTCWGHFVVNYWSLRSSGWLDGEMPEAGGEADGGLLGGETARSPGARSAQGLLCLQRGLVFLCRSNLDALRKAGATKTPNHTLPHARLYLHKP